MPTELRKHGLFGGDWIGQDAPGDWANRLEAQTTKYINIVARVKTEQAQIRNAYKAAAQAEAFQALDNRFYAEFTKIGGDDIKLVRQHLAEWKRLFGVDAWSPPTGDDRRIHRAGLIQQRWQKIGDDKAAFIARRDLLFASAAAGDTDSMFGLVDLPKLEQMILFDEDDVRKAIRIYRQSAHPKQAEMVKWARAFIQFSRDNALAAKKAAGFSAPFGTKWEMDADGRIGFTKAMADVSAFVIDLPNGDDSIETVLMKHGLRPTLSLPQEPETSAETAG